MGLISRVSSRTYRFYSFNFLENAPSKFDSIFTYLEILQLSTVKLPPNCQSRTTPSLLFLHQIQRHSSPNQSSIKSNRKTLRRKSSSFINFSCRYAKIVEFRDFYWFSTETCTDGIRLFAF